MEAGAAPSGKCHFTCVSLMGTVLAATPLDGTGCHSEELTKKYYAILKTISTIHYCTQIFTEVFALFKQA